MKMTATKKEARKDTRKLMHVMAKDARNKPVSKERKELICKMAALTEREEGPFE